MAITHPQRLPQTGAARQRFEPLRVDYAAPETGGRIGAQQAGFPLWEATWDLGKVGPERADIWAAFVDACDGPMNAFLASDVSRPMPLLHPDFSRMRRPDGSPFDGTATSWSVDETGVLVTLNGIPRNLQLSLRDYVGFVWETEGEPRRALVRVNQSARANSSGVIVPEVRMAVPSIVPETAVATLKDPTCLMKLIPDRTVVGEMDRRQQRTVRIAARQELLP